MYINSIKFNNWKCFPDEVNISFANLEIFNLPNGSGKTSVIEAIYYGLFGKTDNNIASYQNHEGETEVELNFDIKGHTYRIERKLVAKKAILWCDDKELKNGVREVFTYMNSILDYDMVRRLWFKGEIADSEIIDYKFFKNTILGEKLREPNLLYDHYRKLARNKNTEANKIIVDETRAISEVEKDIAEVTDQLKNKTHTNESQYLTALHAKETKEKIDALDRFFKTTGKSPIPQQDIRTWKNIDIETCKREIDEENNKLTDGDSSLEELSNQTIRSILKVNDTKCKCVICDGEWKQDRSSYIHSLIEKGLKDNQRIANLEKQIEFKLKFTEEEIEKSTEWWSLTSDYKEIDYEKIIASYNEANNEAWDRLNSLTHEKEKATRAEEAQKHKADLLQEVADAKEKSEFIHTYITKATEAYTEKLLNMSAEILERINPTYTGIKLEDEDMLVMVRGEWLYVWQLSRGEKTMVALALVYTIRELFANEMPLIFDESFASLSSQNAYKVIDFISHTQQQIIVVSHSKDWIEYPDYNELTNVRTSWSE